MPTSKQIYKRLIMENPTPVPKTYTEKQLVDFGNYLLSRKRFDSIWEGHRDKPLDQLFYEFEERISVVHQEDIDNALGESN